MSMFSLDCIRAKKSCRFCQVNVDVVLPAIVIPTGILIGTLHPALTCLALVFMPLALITSYRIWLGMKKKPRTRLFFSWGLVSVAQMFMTFQCVVVPYREVLLGENLLLTSIVLLMLYALYVLRTNTGFLSSRPETSCHTADATQLFDSRSRSDDDDTNGGGSAQMLAAERESSQSHCVTVDSSGSNDEHSQTQDSQEAGATDQQQDTEDNVAEFGAIGAVLVENFGFDKGYALVYSTG